jgi:tRNA (guanine-N7-)-methyltransferase
MSTPENPTPPDFMASAQHHVPADVAHPKLIRSFVRRAGRTTTGQAKAMATWGPQFVLPYQPQALDLDATFGRRAPRLLEIGFGMGDATAHIAQAQPERDFLCCEVHQPGVGALLKHIGERGIGNIRIVAHDALEVLDHMLPPDSLAGIHLFFPDPWHKLRHNKRRLVQPAVLPRLLARLAMGGTIHCATDWEPYAQQMLEVFSAEPRLCNLGTPELGGYAPKPDYRPETKFERRGLKLGHGVWDVVFERVG